MCGIVGYIGPQEATGIVLDGLRRLEYRGYDSAGVATHQNGSIEIRRAEGKLANLEKILRQQPVSGTCGIGHTRWATHGRPSETNAHPHYAGGIVVVHNGIIENYLELKDTLIGKGHSFNSETDTEVIAHLVEDYHQQGNNFVSAVRKALHDVRGAYAVAILCEQDPDIMIAAKSGSPLVMGSSAGEYFVASDIPAMLSHTREITFLEDGEMVIFRNNHAEITDLEGQIIEKTPKIITWDPIMAEKGGYKHFMLKEIYEQPRAIADTLAGRLLEDEGDVYLDGLNLNDVDLNNINKIFIVACGTSWHAALVGKYLLEKHCRIPVDVDIASEFRYRNPIVDQHTLTLLLSQSGETADTLAAMREAKNKGSKVVSICNVVESSIPRECDGVIYTHAGPEIGVASTKAFTTQLIALTLLAIRLGRCRATMSCENSRELMSNLVALPRKVEQALDLNDSIEPIAREFMTARDFLYLGRGNQFPAALEGALKLKEISYIHAEGYPAGELKHGPIALIDEQMPIVVLVPVNETSEKVVSNMREVQARGGRVIAVTNQAGESFCTDTDGLLTVPDICDDLMPILTSVPLQLLAYHIAVLKGTDVDQPRNLAKSVTVE